MRTAMMTLLALMASLGTGAVAAVRGDVAACTGAPQPSVLVRVDGFKARTGIVRVQVYGSDPADWLEKGQKLKRIDLPVPRTGAMDVCVGLPASGRYAVAVRHDLDGDGKSSWNDGGGFSRNPKISLVNLKPRYDAVAIDVGQQSKTVEVVLNYRHGLSIRPIRPGAFASK